MSFNWRSGNLAVSIINSNKNTIKFKTVQNIDFALDDNIEVMDSLNQQRLGYYYPPRRIRVTMGVLPATYNSAATNDAATLFKLQVELINGNVLDGIFTLNVTDDFQSVTYSFIDCIVMQGGPQNILMDRRPQSQWTLLALDAEMHDSTGMVIGSYLKQGAVDTA